MNARNDALRAASTSVDVQTRHVQSGGRWHYGYVVTNNSDRVVGNGRGLGSAASRPADDWALAVQHLVVPYFVDAGIGDTIIDPPDWTHQLLDEDVFGLGQGAGAIVWFTDNACGIVGGGETLSGFGYSSPHAPVTGAFKATFGAAADFRGHPAIPGSPKALAAGVRPVSVAPRRSSIGRRTLRRLLSWLGRRPGAARRGGSVDGPLATRTGTMVPTIRIERMTSRLQGGCSTS